MLNQPRAIDYEFKVLRWEGWVWLFDDSCRTYACSTIPSIYLYPLYPVDESESEYPPDPTYIGEELMSSCETVFVMSFGYLYWTEEGIDEKDAELGAWELAIEEAQSNHYIGMNPTTEMELHQPEPEPKEPTMTILTADELAEILRLKPSTLRKMVREGKIPAIKLGRIYRFDLDKVMEALSTTPNKKSPSEGSEGL